MVRKATSPSTSISENRARKRNFTWTSCSQQNKNRLPRFQGLPLNYLMKDFSPAIFPPRGIRDTKSTNPSVLDWVQHVARLTEPENIFWCDGSKKENDYLLDQACRQGILVKLNQ